MRVLFSSTSGLGHVQPMLALAVAAGPCASASRVYITGHSAGSGIAATMSAAYPDLYAAAGLAAGCGGLACADVTGLTAYRELGSRARPIPAYITWGTADDTNPHPTGRVQLQQWLGMNDLADDGLPNLSAPRIATSIQESSAAADQTAFTMESYQGRRGCGRVDFTTVIGGGHVPDFASAPILPKMIDFLLTHAMPPDC